MLHTSQIHHFYHSSALRTSFSSSNSGFESAQWDLSVCGSWECLLNNTPEQNEEICTWQSKNQRAPFCPSRIPEWVQHPVSTQLNQDDVKMVRAISTPHNRDLSISRQRIHQIHTWSAASKWAPKCFSSPRATLSGQCAQSNFRYSITLSTWSISPHRTCFGHTVVQIRLLEGAETNQKPIFAALGCK